MANRNPFSVLTGSNQYGGEPSELLQQFQNNPQIQGALGSEGISLPTQLKQNFILPEPGTSNWFGRHPRASMGIENAFLGLANMGPTSESAGENISNVARSVLAIPEMRDQHQMQQLMAPFGIAGQLANMRKTQAEVGMNQSKADMFDARAHYWNKGGASRQSKAIIKMSGQPLMRLNGDNQLEQVTDTNGHPVIAPTTKGAEPNPLNHTFYGMNGQLPEQQNMTSDERKASMELNGRLHGALQKEAVARAGGIANAQIKARTHIPGYLSPAETIAVNHTVSSTQAEITAMQKEAAMLTGSGENSLKYQGQWQATQGFKSDEEGATGLKQHVAQLQKEIQFKKELVNEYPVFAANTGGSIKDFEATKRGGPINDPSSQGIEVTPINGSDDEKAASEFIDNQ